MNEKRSMRACLLAISGRETGKRVWLDPTSPLRVGRSSNATWIIPDDSLAPVHFELSWKGESCTLTRLTRMPCLVNGQPMEESVSATNGTVVSAGQMTFLLRVVSSDLRAFVPPPPPDVRDATAELLASRRAVFGTLSQTPRLFAILDAARDRRIQPLLNASAELHESLFEGPKARHLAAVAPHLVEFTSQSELLEVLISDGWGESWGVFLVGLRPFKEVRRRLRRFLMVTDQESGKRLYFRYYDPRVLRTFWPTCSPRQRSEMLGTEIESFQLEGPDDELIRFDS